MLGGVIGLVLAPGRVPSASGRGAGTTGHEHELAPVCSAWPTRHGSGRLRVVQQAKEAVGSGIPLLAAVAAHQAPRHVHGVRSELAPGPGTSPARIERRISWQFRRIIRAGHAVPSAEILRRLLPLEGLAGARRPHAFGTALISQAHPPRTRVTRVPSSSATDCPAPGPLLGRLCGASLRDRPCRTQTRRPLARVAAPARKTGKAGRPPAPIRVMSPAGSGAMLVLPGLRAVQRR